jgi:hypothetical protein
MNLQTDCGLAKLCLQGKAYKVSQAEVLEDEPGTTNYVFQPATTDDVLSDKAAHLEVIRQVMIKS